MSVTCSNRCVNNEVIFKIIWKTKKVWVVSNLYSFIFIEAFKSEILIIIILTLLYFIKFANLKLLGVILQYFIYYIIISVRTNNQIYFHLMGDPSNLYIVLFLIFVNSVFSRGFL